MLITNIIQNWSKKYFSYEYQLKRFKKNKHKIKEICIKKIPIEQINPFDCNHNVKTITECKDHKEGIRMVKELINNGKKILPILVTSFKSQSYIDYCGYQYNMINGLDINFQYQRLDGFKRYFAFKELGHKHIECIFDENSFPGGQHNMNWVIDNKEDMILEYSFIQTLGTKIFDI
tara:strand:- start:1464 stop:1991 length:528 start_codon:yes stop_codon:yes gene_type:complete